MPSLSEAQVTAALCRKDYSFFVKQMWSTIVPEPCHWNWHMDLSCAWIQEAYERVFVRAAKDWDLLTNQAPGSSKSILHSVMAMPWAWTRDPTLRFLAASYSAPCAEKLSLYCRDVLRSKLYTTCFPEVQIRTDVDNKSHFMTAKGGERFATSVGGSATGLSHAHVIVIDDPLNPQQATSEAEVAAANHWITHTLLSRKVDAAVTFVDVVGQRLCQGDPFDEFQIISPRVKHIVIPADLDYEVKPPELKEYYIDGLMDPIRKGHKVLEEEKAKGDVYYASQFGQSPVPPGGGTFKCDRLRFGRPPEQFKLIARGWDKASTSAQESRRAAYTAGVKMAQDHEGRFWVLDVVRGRWDTFAREDLIYATAKRDGRGCLVVQEQEAGGGGKDSAVGTMRRLSGFRVRTVVARGKKEIRADEFSVAVNAGNVWLPESMRQGNQWVGWARDLVDELRFWPFGKWKDQGDASALAFGGVSRGRIRVGPLKKRQENAKEYTARTGSVLK